MNEISRFLKIIGTQTDKNSFSPSGKINVLKSRLIGPERDYWNSYDGTEDLAAAQKFLLARYPDVQSYGNLLIKVNNLKRSQGEQISNFATKVVDIYDRLQTLHLGKTMSLGSVRSDSIQKLIEVLPQQDRL